ncbi:MAG TPA: DUF3467 domain-containing protein [Methanoculleus sp.]|nr:DUF3467 domain-containing protein [Methanoculleus sp.]
MVKKTEDSDSESMVIDLRDLYKYKPEDIMPDISYSTYSNLAYIQVTHRDVYIDFLEMPGIKREDGKMHVDGTRVFMSHAAAQKLAEALNGILEKVYSEGGMENYCPADKEKSELTSKVIRKSANKST